MFDKEYLYKTYFGMTDGEATEMEDRVKKEMDAEGGQDMMGGMGAPMPGAPPPGEEGPAPGVEDAGDGIAGEDPQNTPPGTTHIGKPGNVATKKFEPN